LSASVLHLAYSTPSVLFLFANYPAPTQLCALSLHDALPISSPGSRQTIRRAPAVSSRGPPEAGCYFLTMVAAEEQRLGSRVKSPDRKSTRLNSSHQIISYAVFCLKKKKKREYSRHTRVLRPR